MGASQRHIIQTQEIEIRAQEESTATAMQQIAGRLAKGALSPLIDRYCSQYSDPNVLHRIETLELDLGAIPATGFETVFLERFEAALAGQLPPAIQRFERQRGAGDFQAQSRLELLAFFMETGNLPWWADRSRPDLIDSAVLFLLKNDPARLGLWLKTALQQPGKGQRLVAHLNIQTVRAVAAQYLPRSGAPLWSTLLGDRWHAFLATRSQLPAKEIQRISAVLLLAQGISLPSQEAFGAQAAMLERLARAMALPYSELLDVLEKFAGAEQKGLAALIRQLRQLAAEPSPQKAPKQGDRPDDKTPIEGHEQDSKPSLPSQSEQRRNLKNRDIDKAQLQFSAADEIYLDNAGLVLIGSFLPAFLRRLDLVDEKDFVSEVARHRAVWLLHYLCTGVEDMPEYQAPLLKVFCGIEPEQPLEPVDALSEIEKSEADVLLEVVVGHAPVLKNMSADGLRGSYLLREGLLSQRDGHWLVQVERQSYDVLLDRIPWSFRLLKLPWLKSLIAVEW